MGGNGLVGRLRDMLDGLSGRNRINKFDFGILQTMMMVAALDGEVTAKELAEFEDLASQCRGFSEKSFKAVWDAALRSAGYIMLLARVESRENLVAAFVREAEKPFTSEVKLEGREDREWAVDCLEHMAASDGDFSDVERECISALAERVRKARADSVEGLVGNSMWTSPTSIR